MDGNSNNYKKNIQRAFDIYIFVLTINKGQIIHWGNAKNSVQTSNFF